MPDRSEIANLSDPKPALPALPPVSAPAPAPVPGSVPIPAQPPVDDDWVARLELGFERGAGPGAGATRLALRRHVGPLRLLKALASTDGRRLEGVIVHPPGGLAAGDRLEIDVTAGAGTATVLTTPGAQKWYRSADGRLATTRTRLAIDGDAALDWLPQPSILFEGARAVQTLAIDLAPTASTVGWEILVRGRAAMGERWTRGSVDQQLTIAVGGTPWWRQRLAATADDRLFRSALGWRDRRVAGSVWWCSPGADREMTTGRRDHWRRLIDRAAGAGLDGDATAVVDGFVLAQMLGDDSEAVFALAIALWQAARDDASIPRIWRT